METVDCQKMNSRLMACFDQPEADHDLTPILDHITGCPHCRHRLGYLVRALTSEMEDGLTCDECETFFPEYLQAKKKEGVMAKKWLPITYHLETCVHCATEFADFSDLYNQAISLQNVQPPAYPVPDLAFLTTEKGKRSYVDKLLWELDELGRFVVQFSAELISAWQPSSYHLASLKKHDAAPKTLYELSVNEINDDLEVDITVEETKGDPSTCTITVMVEIASRGGWPNLTGVEVMLKKDGTLVTALLTNAFGKVAFEGILTNDLGRLSIEILPYQKEL